MVRTFLKSKIHRAALTQTELAYEGSITLDPELMTAADIKTYEKVQVLNLNNGARFETYVIRGKAGSGQICLNGPAARLGQVGDTVIVVSYVQLAEDEQDAHVPVVVLVDGKNKVKSVERQE